MSEERTGTSLDRRQLLGAGAAVAVGGLVLNEVLAAPNPAAQVEDRGSDIRIRALRSHRAGSRVYVQLETNQKVTGWGEISALEPAAAAELATSLFELLIQLAAAIQPYDILFLEEPAVPGNIEVFKRLKQAIHIPLATGERDRTIWEMIAYLQNGCIDILQPDVAHTGGITQMKKIATLAEAYHVPLAPHCTTSPLGATASLHVGAAVPLLLIHETAPNVLQWGEQFARKTWTIDKDGFASIPRGPGLGVEMDEKALTKVGADPKQPAFRWPVQRLRDGSIADY